MRVINLVFLINITLMFRSFSTMVTTHFKCRNNIYPRSSIERFSVPDDKVNWSVEYPGYKPPNFTSRTVYGKPWADLVVGDNEFHPKWNSLDGNISRLSYTGQYEVIHDYPRNPIGRTGLIGRGVLGKWGPNHAADPVVTRWKKFPNGTSELDSSDRPILQFIAVKRNDTGEWALPGGMVDPGEKVTTTAIREFQEEAMNSFDMSEDEKKSWESQFKEFFSQGDEVYKGYVDDPRNTDNSWMETVAYNFHDPDGDIVGALKLNAGDDAVGVRWVDITPDIKLYASHKDIVTEVLKRHMKQ